MTPTPSRSEIQLHYVVPHPARRPPSGATILWFETLTAATLIARQLDAPPPARINIPPTLYLPLFGPTNRSQLVAALRALQRLIAHDRALNGDTP